MPELVLQDAAYLLIPLVRIAVVDHPIIGADPQGDDMKVSVTAGGLRVLLMSYDMCGRPLRCKRNLWRLATWSGAVMCPASKGAALMTAGHDEIRGSGPNQTNAFFTHCRARVFLILGSTELPSPHTSPSHVFIPAA
ncbi:MAG: hypothetical protein WCF85_18455 [Rhodospirillaceae bacterium]